MQIQQMLQTAGKFIQHNSQTILTGAAVGGVVSTAVLTHKAAYNIGVGEAIGGTPGSHKEYLRQNWREYVPPVLMGGATISCIVAAHTVGQRRQAALAGAYSLVDKAFVEYKEKVIEQIGVNKEQKVRDEIAQDRVAAQDFATKEVHVTLNGEVDFLDTWTDRRFKSSMETIRGAENDINHQILHGAGNGASLNDLYRIIGLRAIETGDELGWNTDHQLEVVFNTALSGDGVPCITMGFRHNPQYEFYRHG